MEGTTTEEVVADLVAAAPNLVLTAVLLGVVAVVHRHSMRLPDRVVLPGIAASALVLAAVSALVGSTQVLVSGLVGGVVAFVALFAAALAQPSGVGFGTVKASVLVGVPAGVLGTLAWLTGLAVAVAVGTVWAGVAHRRARRTGGSGTVPTGVLLLVWLGVAALTPWLHLGVAAGSR